MPENTLSQNSNSVFLDIREKVLARMDLSREVPDEEIEEVIFEVLSEENRQRALCLEEKKRLGSMVFNSLRKLDILQELIEDEDITEILVNGPNAIFYEKEGRLTKWNQTFSSPQKLEDVIQQIAGRNNKMVNESLPIVDTRLRDGSRVNIVLPPIAIDGAAMSIRRFPKTPITMEKLIMLDSISAPIAEFLNKLVRAKYNIFISGGTGSGKTTFLNALSAFIPKEERIVTIEDSAELQIHDAENLVRLETRCANFEGIHEITIRDLIRTALRMRPDRIIVGEVRGEETLDMLQAMQSGHDGSLSTGHADSCEDMLYRLETMVLMGMDLPLPAIRAQIGSGIDIMVHLGRIRDKSRKLLDIQEVLRSPDGNTELNCLYQFEETHEEGGRVYGVWKKTGTLKNLKKCRMAGITL